MRTAPVTDSPNRLRGFNPRGLGRAVMRSAVVVASRNGWNDDERFGGEAMAFGSGTRVESREERIAGE